mmetsp:Transcript_68502/g.196492  ORF Transcript_68502/g.196492 Transcript_68502/m.196492 type:complete len:372 (+) Transcript_68502:287-1402(+)
MHGAAMHRKTEKDPHGEYATIHYLASQAAPRAHSINSFPSAADGRGVHPQRHRRRLNVGRRLRGRGVLELLDRILGGVDNLSTADEAAKARLEHPAQDIEEQPFSRITGGGDASQLHEPQQQQSHKPPQRSQQREPEPLLRARGAQKDSHDDEKSQHGSNDRARRPAQGKPRGRAAARQAASAAQPTRHYADNCCLVFLISKGYAFRPCHALQRRQVLERLLAGRREALARRRPHERVLALVLDHADELAEVRPADLRTSSEGSASRGPHLPILMVQEGKHCRQVRGSSRAGLADGLASHLPHVIVLRLARESLCEDDKVRPSNLDRAAEALLGQQTTGLPDLNFRLPDLLVLATTTKARIRRKADVPLHE